MNPDLEFFLEDAFAPIKQSFPEVGRVVVEPDYNAKFIPEDAQPLCQELRELLDRQKPSGASLHSHDGFEATIGDDYPLLQRYVRRVVLHSDEINGDWVEVMPPGNWI
jgi:hypothetical protein